jgi:PAS domain S-box-containing protein
VTTGSDPTPGDREPTAEHPGVLDAQPADASHTVPSLRGEIAFRLLVEAVEDYAIFLLGPDGRVMTWNLGAERIKGYTADEIIGEHFSRFYIAEERDANRPMRVLGLAAEHGRFEDVGWRVRKDGTRFWADVIITALRGPDGRPYAYAKVTRDLTERRAAEERERALLIEQEARAAAEEALRARDRFLSIASHELKTPAASLRLTVDSLIRTHASGRLDAERLTAGLRRIDTATERMGLLVAELLDVARLQSGTRSIQPAPIDLASVVREVADRFAGVEEGGDRLRMTTSGDTTLLGDISLLDQVVTNLIDNAVKYSPPQAPVEITIAGGQDGVTLAVADHGVGIDDQAAARLFEAFGRGSNVEHIPGLGLGLHIAREIIDRHHGSISADPRANGSGTELRVWLPREPVS